MYTTHSNHCSGKQIMELIYMYSSGGERKCPWGFASPNLITTVSNHRVKSGRAHYFSRHVIQHFYSIVLTWHFRNECPLPIWNQQAYIWKMFF